MKAQRDCGGVIKGATLLMLLVSFVWGLSVSPAKEVKNGKVKEIMVEAYQHGYSPDPIVVKKGDKVRLIATSRDVPHGLVIKEYAISAVVRKGQDKIIEFTAKKAGVFAITCNVYCGVGHPNMKGRLTVKE